MNRLLIALVVVFAGCNEARDPEPEHPDKWVSITGAYFSVKYQEITLADGTPCVIAENSGGGSVAISCGWRK